MSIRKLQEIQTATHPGEQPDRREAAPAVEEEDDDEPTAEDVLEAVETVEAETED